MTLVLDNFFCEYPPHKFSAGTVLEVDQVTADRWLKAKLAVPSAKTDKTALEMKRAEAERLAAQIQELEEGTATGAVGVPTAAIRDAAAEVAAEQAEQRRSHHRRGRE